MPRRGGTPGGVPGQARRSAGVVGGLRGADTRIGRLRRSLDASRAAFGCLFGVTRNSVHRWEMESYQPDPLQRVLLDALDRVRENRGESTAAGIVRRAHTDLDAALHELFALDPGPTAGGAS